MATDFTIADVLAWARTKPAEEQYNYGDPRNCALCQFLRDTRRARKPAVSLYLGWGEAGESFSRRREYPKELEPALQAKTFGALVTRLEALCPDTPITSDNWLKIDAYLSDIEQVSA